MNIADVVDELRQERKRLQGELQKIDAALDALRTLNRKGRSASLRRRRKMSAQARRKIAAAQRARWARVKSGTKAKR